MNFLFYVSVLINIIIIAANVNHSSLSPFLRKKRTISFDPPHFFIRSKLPT